MVGSGWGQIVVTSGMVDGPGRGSWARDASLEGFSRPATADEVWTRTAEGTSRARGTAKRNPGREMTGLGGELDIRPGGWENEGQLQVSSLGTHRGT